MKPIKVVSYVAAVILASAMAHAEDTASISGKIVFTGTAPKMKIIKMDADPVCSSMHTDKAARGEEVVVNPNGTLKNVFVYVKSGLTGTYEAPKKAVEIEQLGCVYHPHVFGMMAKQLLIVHNADDTLHNIHALPSNSSNDEFNKGQPAGSPDLKKTFANDDVMVKFKCDVHPWMTAYCGVVDNPFYAVTGDDGTFSLKGLPAGDYEIEAWQEKYGPQIMKIKVGAGEAKTLDFTFKPTE